MRVDEIMRYKSEFSRGRFGNTDIEFPVTLSAICGDDPGPETTGKTNGCCRFADGGRTDDDDYGRRLHRFS
jgi:hypothetical protein